MDLIDTLPHIDRIAHHRPRPRLLVGEDGWTQAIDKLATGACTLLGLWGDDGFVHMALMDAAYAVTVVSYACKDGRFPNVGGAHPPAVRLERAIRDLHGLDAVGSPDERPWLDHGQWPTSRSGAAPTEYQFLPAEGEGLHQVPVGPVHAGTIEPGHFRFTANGEHVVRLEQRFGYAHKGIQALLQGATLARGALFAGRTSGDSTVAYAFAFALAAEAALQVTPPARAIALRGLAAEMERLANHIGDIGAICNDASFALMHAQTGILRERCLRAAQACFGHRLMMDVIVPGGVARDIAADGPATLRALIADLREVFPRLVELYDSTASLLDRAVTAGIVKPEYATRFGAGGYVGRASGRDFDARRDLAYAPYDRLRFDVPVLAAGDVNARVWIRIREVEQTLSIVEQLLDDLPQGDIATELQFGARCEGLALTEAFRGDVLVWLRLDADGRIGRCHLRDASWFHWPLLEAAIDGNIVADFPLCNKSFNCSYSGHDL